ncbi:MAG: site-specific integrase [Ignavibacteriae bacterium]|nr:site-specific integrase [Ignavibacteriota bacterium]
MASIYKKDNKIYISWYDTFESKPKSKALGLKYNSENLKIAERLKKAFELELQNKINKLNQIGIVKDKLSIAIEHFYRNNSNKAPGTIDEYDWFFEKLNKKFNKDESCLQLTKLSCEAWLTSFRTSNYQQNTLFKISKVLKKFLNFLFEYNYVPMFKLNKDVTFKRAVKPIIVFSSEDLKKLIDGLKTKNSNFRTTFNLLIYTGLRPSDIYELKVSDINFTDNILSYYSPKTNEHFMVPMHPNLIPILKERISEVKEGKILEYESINNIGKAYRRYLTKQKLQNKGYTLRTFRKTFITLAHASGMDLATVSKLAGHKQINTTQKYYNQLNLTKQALELNKLEFPTK